MLLSFLRITDLRTGLGTYSSSESVVDAALLETLIRDLENTRLGAGHGVGIESLNAQQWPMGTVIRRGVCFSRILETT